MPPHVQLWQATQQIFSSVTNQSIFNKEPYIIKVIRAQERIPTSQSGSPTTKDSELTKKRPKSSHKCHVLLCQGTQHLKWLPGHKNDLILK